VRNELGSLYYSLSKDTGTPCNHQTWLC